MADYHPDWESVLQKGRQGHREQDPDLYDWFTYRHPGGGAVRVS